VFALYHIRAHRFQETVMSKWISSIEVLQKIEDEQLLYYLSQGLQPYSKSEQQPIPCDYCRHKAYYLFDRKHKKITARLRAIDYFLQFGQGLHEQKETTFPANNYEWLAFDYLQDKLELFQQQAGLEAIVVSPADSEKLHDEKEKAEKELAEVETEIEAIVADDPDFQDWRYFVIPDAKEEVQEVVESLTEALFKHEDIVKCSRMDFSGDEMPKQFWSSRILSDIWQHRGKMWRKLPW
jgi:hypothetical protein